MPGCCTKNKIWDSECSGRADVFSVWDYWPLEGSVKEKPIRANIWEHLGVSLCFSLKVCGLSMWGLYCLELPFQMWDTDSTQTHAWKKMGIHTWEKPKLKEKSLVLYFFLLTSHSSWNLSLHLQTETSGISAVEMFGFKEKECHTLIWL